MPADSKFRSDGKRGRHTEHMGYILAEMQYPAARLPRRSVVSVATASRTDAAWAVLDTVLDPEVPVLSVRELGIVRDVIEADDGLEVVLTPTYSGCPATEAIERSVRRSAHRRRSRPGARTLQRAPAWTTDWISEPAKRKLREYGIAPPHLAASDGAMPIRIVPRVAVECPRCGSGNTERLSAFGATACKALYRCIACREPFEHFKAI